MKTPKNNDIPEDRGVYKGIPVTKERIRQLETLFAQSAKGVMSFINDRLGVGKPDLKNEVLAVLDSAEAEILSVEFFRKRIFELRCQKSNQSYVPDRVELMDILSGLEEDGVLESAHNTDISRAEWSDSDENPMVIKAYSGSRTKEKQSPVPLYRKKR